MLIPCFVVSALEEDAGKEYLAELEESVGQKLEEALPESATRVLRENGVESFDVGQLAGFSFFGFLGNTLRSVGDYFSAPFRLLASLIGIFLLLALLQACHPPGSKMRAVEDLLGVTSCMVLLSSPVFSCVERTVNVITECSQFLLSFIPVFTGLAAAGGNAVSSAAYSAFLFTAVQVISQISSTVLTPLLCIYLAICIVGTLNTSLHLDEIAQAVKKAVVWTIGLLLTVFVALLSVQSLVGNSADTAAIKTTKFFIGSLIPVFGSAFSDLYNSMHGWLGFIRQITGSFGILVILAAFLPVLLEALAMMVSLQIGQAIGSLFGVESLCRLLRSVLTMLSLLFGLILCFAVMIILSTTILMLMAFGI